jgi:GT2 family glycosyltransferase
MPSATHDTSPVRTGASVVPTDRDDAALTRPERNPADLTIVVVSFNDGRWLERCLTSVRERTAGLEVDLVLVDNGSDGAHELVRRRFGGVRTLTTQNRGFANANNVALTPGFGRYVLFLNPDTEVIDGDIAELVAMLDRRPEIGVAGVRQVTADGTLWPTIRYFPSFPRALGDALGLERWRGRPRWAGERELDAGRYERECECDWTSGSFMLARAEALQSAGLFDERFFLFSEETDLCRRIKQAGWIVRHIPSVTIVHHAGKGGVQARIAAQAAFSRRLYAAKHLPRPHRGAYLAAIALGHALRAGLYRPTSPAPHHAASRLALRTLLGLSEPPFGLPPQVAVTPRRGSGPEH